jgi:hypothetical protein
MSRSVSSDVVQRRAAIALNIVTVVLAAYMTVSIVVRRFDAGADSRPLLQIGDEIQITGVDWSKNPRTLVLALSANCRFCGEGSAFYAALLRMQKAGSWGAIAAFPESVETAQAYMRGQGYAIDQSYQVPLSRIGVTATPTLLVVDQNGRLVQQWIGVLGPSEEADVAAHLGVDEEFRTARVETDRVRTSATTTWSPVVTTSELQDLLKTGAVVNVIDVRERHLYAARRLGAARNIPVDELAIRAPHELRPDLPIIVYCSFSAACEANGVPSLCSQAASQLRRVGMTDVRVIRDRLAQLESMGVIVKSSLLGSSP